MRLILRIKIIVVNKKLLTIYKLLITTDKRTSLTAISSKPRLALAGVIVDTIYTRSAISACVINTLVYVCR